MATNTVTFKRRRDNTETAYVKVGDFRFKPDEPVYEVPEAIVDQLAADQSLVVEVEQESAKERDARVRAAEEAAQALQASREARRAHKQAAAEGRTQEASKPEEPIPDYADLKVAEVVAVLEQASPAEVEAIKAWEADHEDRVTIREFAAEAPDEGDDADLTDRPPAGSGVAQGQGEATDDEGGE